MGSAFSLPCSLSTCSKEGGHRRSLATIISQQLRDEVDPDPSQQAPGQRHHKQTQLPWTTLAARISSKLEEGDFKGAVRLASSEDTIRDPNGVTVEALRSKHPTSHPESVIPPAALTL